MSFLDIPVAHGRLEGLLAQSDSPLAAALVCHPDPAHGGTMHNHLTYRIAKAFQRRQVTTLRFNFRGVGSSTGSYDQGRGELQDAQAAFEFLVERFPQVPLYVAGFSFGSRIALQLALADDRVRGVLAVGLAIELLDFSFIGRISKPKAFIQASDDEYGPLSQVEALLSDVPEPKKLFVIPGADHLGTGRLPEFEKLAAAAVDWLLSTPSG